MVTFTGIASASSKFMFCHVEPNLAAYTTFGKDIEIFGIDWGTSIIHV